MNDAERNEIAARVYGLIAYREDNIEQLIADIRSEIAKPHEF